MPSVFRLPRRHDVLWVLLAAELLAGWAAAQPFGLERRVEWTNARLIGSPEPPLPYTVEKVFTRLDLPSPMYVADEPGTEALLVVLQGGAVDKPSRIVQFQNDPDVARSEVVLEVPRRMVYSLCFHPDYLRNRQVFVFSNGETGEKDRTNQITRYVVDREAPFRFNTESAEVVLEWKSGGHDGGDMAFGLDGMLYITTGDGTSDSDTWNSGQTLDDLLGSVLRIDVNRRDGDLRYGIPSDNPFVGRPDTRGEIWAYGLRNPWRMGIDPRTGHVWVGNNGQDLWETAHLVRPGENYGWSVYEGNHPFYLGRKRGPTPHVAPTIEHHHSAFRSLTGGVVYYGELLASLKGAYIYGDYSSGRIWGMHHDGRQVLWHRELADTSLQISAFRVDQRGNLLVVDHGSGLYRLVPSPAPETPLAPFPTRLSDTGLFRDTARLVPADGLIPYSVRVPGWADGATADRYMAIPGREPVNHDARKSWTFPNGTALVQTLSLETEPGVPTSGRRLETRVLLRQQGEWAGYSYRWNEDQSDAVLVPADGADLEIAVTSSGTAHRQSWRIPSRTDCLTCHSRAANFVLGISDAQLNGDHPYGPTTAHQLLTLNHIQLFDKPLTKPVDELQRLPQLADASQELEARVRAYLHVNCSACHTQAGGGNSQMELTFSTARENTRLIGARPQHDTFGISNAMLVAPQDPDRSVLLHRLSRRGAGQMPPLVTRQVDTAAVALVRDWIRQLPPSRPFVQAWTPPDLLPALEAVASGRSFAQGEAAFRDLGCGQCHRLGAAGGTVGPDLKGLLKRQPLAEILDSILLPSKVIAEEYASIVIETANGEVVTGRIEHEDPDKLVLRPVGSTDDVRNLPLREVLPRRKSPVSNMPAGIVDVLRRDELLDLLAYVLSDANPQDPRFQ